MINQIGIEYVCTGNGGRSPVAETIGKDYVKQLKLENKINIFSSGTAVDVTEKDLFQLPINFLLEYIEIGLNSGTYHEKAEDLAKEIVANKQNIAIAVENKDTTSKEKIEHCIRYLMADEVAKRNNVLLEIGLVPRGHFHQQTKVRDDVNLILPMKQSNAKQVKNLYEKTTLNPWRMRGKEILPNPSIVPICEYAGIDGAISDPFGNKIEAFRETRDLISTAVKKSIDRAVGEYVK